MPGLFLLWLFGGCRVRDGRVQMENNGPLVVTGVCAIEFEALSFTRIYYSRSSVVKVRIYHIFEMFSGGFDSWASMGGHQAGSNVI